MREFLRYRALLITMLCMVVAACAKDETITPQPEPQPGPQEIAWSVKATDHKGATRAIVGTETREDFTSLADACNTAKLDHAIGFWVDRITRKGSDKTTERNIFGDNTRLKCTEVDGREIWYYATSAEYWELGGRYLFRAFYPDLLKNYIVDPPTNGQLMILEYNSLKYQHDLMVAHNEVYTVDTLAPTGYNATIYYNKSGKYSDVVAVTNHVDANNLGDFHFSEGFNLNEQVPLMFDHTLAAMRFRFTFNYEDNDELTSIYFRNTEQDKGLATTGMLMYGAFDTFDETGQLDKIHGNIYNTAYADRYENNSAYDYDQAKDTEYNENMVPLNKLNLDKRTFRWDIRPHVAGSPFYIWQVAHTGIDGKKSGVEGRAETYRVGIPFSYAIQDDNSTREELAIAYSAERDYVLRTSSSGSITEEKKHAENRDYASTTTTTTTKNVPGADSGPTTTTTTTEDNGITTITETTVTVKDGVMTTVETVTTKYTVAPEIVLEPNTTAMTSDKDIGPDGVRMAAPTFADNEGWIFVIPQTSDGTTEVCFTTAETGDDGITTMKLPVFTGTSYDEQIQEVKFYSVDKPCGDKTYNELTDQEKRAMDKIYCDYAPGHRYTYTVVIGKTNMFLNISVEPWRERWSSTEIVF